MGFTRTFASLFVARKSLLFLCLSVASVVYLFPLFAQAFTDLAYYEDLSPPRQRAIRQIHYSTDNYSEGTGIVADTDYLTPIFSFALLLCRESSGTPVVDFSAFHLSTSQTELATSSPISTSDMPLCSEISSTTPQSADFTTFSFSSPITLLENESIDVHSLGGAVSMNTPNALYAYGTSTLNAGTNVSTYSCYIDSGYSYTCVSSNFGTSFGLPFYIINGNTFLDPLNSNYVNGFSSTYNTRFTDLEITGTSTVTIEATYFIDGDELNTSISERNPTQLSYGISLRPTTSITNQYTSITNASGTASASSDFTSLGDGVYDLLITFSNFGCSTGLSPCPFPDAYIYQSFTITGGVLSATGTPEYYDKTVPDTENRYRDCSLTQLGNCLTNAGIFLFLPSEASLDNFVTLKDSIATRFPFNYISDFKDAIGGLYTTATTETLTISMTFGTFGDITLLSADLVNAVPFASTIRTILEYLLWIMLVTQIYRRTLKVFNTQETSV